MLKRLFEKIKKTLSPDDNKGFTLIELLVAISILAIVLVPLSQIFIAATKTNSKSRRELQSTLTANSLLEAASAYPISSFDTYARSNDADEFTKIFANIDSSKFKSGALEIEGTTTKKTTGDFEAKADYYAYYVEGLKQSNSTFDALIVFHKTDNEVTIKNTAGNTVNIYTKSSKTPGAGTNFKVETKYKDAKAEYSITVFVYRHGVESEVYVGQNINEKGSKALIMSKGSKFDKAEK